MSEESNKDKCMKIIKENNKDMELFLQTSFAVFDHLNIFNYVARLMQCGLKENEAWREVLGTLRRMY